MSLVINNKSTLIFNENGQFTNAFVELYKENRVGLGRLNQIFFKQDFAKREKELLDPSISDERWCINTAREILICQVAIQAEENFLDTTLLGLIKKVSGWFAHLFGGKTSLEEANDLLAKYRELLTDKKDPSNDSNDMFVSIKKQLKINDTDFQKIKKQAEFEAEMFMAQRCAIIGNRTFQYEVGPANDKKVVFVKPDGECYAVSKKDEDNYRLFFIRHANVYKTDDYKGCGGERFVCSGSMGSNDKDLHGKKVSISMSLEEADAINKTHEAGKLMERVHTPKANSNVIQHYLTFNTSAGSYDRENRRVVLNDAVVLDEVLKDTKPSFFQKMIQRLFNSERRAAVQVTELGSLSLKEYLKTMEPSLIEGNDEGAKWLIEMAPSLSKSLSEFSENFFNEFKVNFLNK